MCVFMHTCQILLKLFFSKLAFAVGKLQQIYALLLFKY